MGRQSSILLLLTAITMAVYSEAGQFAFVNYDDTFYITENETVQKGISFENLRWAFSSAPAPNWNPLAWVAHMVDVELFGMNAGGHHLSSVLLHWANVLLFYLFFFFLTGEMGKSAFIAAIFAIHPLHVESVAWIAERKDVLSTFFWLLTGLAYLRYVARPSLKPYLLVLVLYALGLLAKPMLVTMPFVLLLLDYWPLRRLDNKSGRFKRAALLIYEKIPLFALAAAAGMATFAIQFAGGAVEKLDSIPLWARIGNAFLAYAVYILKTLWPSGLAVFYPHPGTALNVYYLFASVVFFVTLTVVAFAYAEKRPYLFVGWFWYVGMLAPVIGVLQVGSQAMADRYMYVPMVGLLIMVAWGLPDLAPRVPKAVWRTAAALCTALLMVPCYYQVGYWRNSETLFAHAVAVTTQNALAHNNLGTAFFDQRRYVEAEDQFNLAMTITPADVKPYFNLGHIRLAQGRPVEAVDWFAKAASVAADDADVHADFAEALLEAGRPADAEKEGRRAVELDPGHKTAYVNLGMALAGLGRPEEAKEAYRKALELRPDNATAHMNLGNLLARTGELTGALVHFRKGVELEPDNGLAHYNLAAALESQGQYSDARMHYELALGIHENLEAAQAGLRRIDEAMEKESP